MMESGEQDVLADFVRGNNTNLLSFHYKVPEGSVATCLDYVDTRMPPYNVQEKGAWGTTGSTALLVSKYLINAKALHNMPGLPAIVIKHATDNPTIDALLGLPQPGKVGSISGSGCRKIDTSPPEITKVSTSLSHGTYGVGEIIP